MEIAMLLFPRLTLLDAIGPYEVLRRLPDSTLRLVAPAAGPIRTDDDLISLTVEETIDDVPAADVLVVPGGIGTAGVATDARVLDWVRRIDAGSVWTTSVCTGSLILGWAGLLVGKRATSHWTALEFLASLGAEPTEERVVVDGKIVTAAGVSSGIDMALWLASQIADDDTAKAIQLSIEYDPRPPFDSGSTAKADPELVASQFRNSRFFRG
jgi:putative intracellular protease/amidase